jgi:crotonobetaine/carnitine-CoA ligase
VSDRPRERRYDGPWVVSRLLADRADRFGDDTAIRARDGAVTTYAELAAGAARVAGGLASLGVEPGDRVATMLDPGVEYLRTWFASAWAGAIEVPVNTDFKGIFLEHVLRQSGASVLVMHARWLDRLAGLDLPDLRHVVLVGTETGTTTTTTTTTTGAAAGTATGPRVVPFAELSGTAPLGLVDRDEHDVVYVMYTSGTSGPSKGAVHSNRSALWNAYAWLDVLELADDDVAYSMFPLFHVTARSAVVTSTIWAGGQVALRDGFSVSRFWDDVRESDATFFAYMGSVVHLLFAAEPSERDTDHRVRLAFGAAAPPAIVEPFERRFGFELMEVYGSTELGLATAPRRGHRVRGTMGAVCPHVELQVHDEHGHEVAPGDSGEIVARPRSPHAIFQGYWADPEATVHAFRNLWFHSGDRGLLRPDGELVFVDRIKDVIRRRGENISSFEVERSVQQHVDVLEAAAYALPSDAGEDEVAVAVVLRESAHPDPEALLAFFVEVLPRFAVPRYVRFVESLPKTPSQRVQKYKLRDAGITDDTHDREALGVVVPRS